ncbi:acyl-[acyl-carrier-protein] thioesterase [Enterococcus sp. MJM12]|uniref:Acyl-[acyl-carrier-protein] thioesterase n=1 Tax=Candidatus Enterococcus myersii TaxID=2815322 RepID=A0ABS3H9C1_9ENTE|nr:MULTISPECIES: acyl-ACP thioesterase domain-containing protein [Enterococcus]MBO0450054.1 acyl-[acyl-carrier-protein] thioesterase [Enterococcus sp. MJM12]MCD1025781.1 acyl-[acyl-carrier-protein] thioesterase [Enterococcus sp. SMC-9]WHA08640.1 thioesterase [Enterococcus montenegrensis]
MAVKYTRTHEVAYYECDVNQTMTFPAMIGVAIKTSEEQSDTLNRSAEFVHQFGLTWVITNYHFKINRLPKVGEVIQIATQAMEYNKYFCYRNFWFYDEKGNELLMIESVFVLMDIKNRKMASVPEEIIAPFESEKIKRIKRFPAITKVTNGQSLPYRVRFYDIDSNQHVNNAMYFNWMIDVLGFDFLTTHVPQVVNIRFDKEVEYGNEVMSHYEIIAEDTIESRHEIKIGTQLYCEANISWIEK